MSAQEEPTKTEDEREVSPEAMEAFQAKILELYQAEKSDLEKIEPERKHLGNWTYRFDPVQTFKTTDLGIPEFELWEAFKACQAKEKTVAECLVSFENYKRLRAGDKEETSLARSGFESYVGNKLSVLSGREQVAERERQLK